MIIIMKDRYVKLIRNIIEVVRLSEKHCACVREVRKNISLAEWDGCDFDGKAADEAFNILGKEKDFDFFADYPGEAHLYPDREKYSSKKLQSLLIDFRNNM